MEKLYKKERVIKIKRIKKIILGILSGFIFGFFATGGGMILLPGLMYLLKMEPTKARGTTICCILVMAISSSFFYYKSNYIDWKISLLCALGGIAGGFIGAKILKKVPEQILRIIFTILIVYVSYKMIF